LGGLGYDIQLMTANQSITHLDRSGTGSDPTPDGARSTGSGPSQTGLEEPSPPSGDEVLTLLGDEYVADIVEALAHGPMPARELAERTGMSRATAYRRLERLKSAGLVASHTTVESAGHHRQAFRLVLDELEIVIDEDGFDCTARLGDCPDV
jgi:DNA-binding transcriptional ArsR family regulator